MTKSAVVLPKPNRGGRPATGRDPVRAIRLPDEFVAEVDAGAAKQDDRPGRSEAIRSLIARGLKAKPISNERSWRGRSLDLGTMAKIAPAAKAARSSHAAEVAAVAIDRMADPAAHLEGREELRRRPAKGRPEFNEVRVDRSKVKAK
jgi:hypothetical protein